MKTGMFICGLITLVIFSIRALLGAGTFFSNLSYL